MIWLLYHITLLIHTVPLILLSHLPQYELSLFLKLYLFIGRQYILPYISYLLQNFPNFNLWIFNLHLLPMFLSKIYITIKVETKVFVKCAKLIKTVFDFVLLVHFQSLLDCCLGLFESLFLFFTFFFCTFTFLFVGAAQICSTDCW